MRHICFSTFANTHCGDFYSAGDATAPCGQCHLNAINFCNDKFYECLSAYDCQDTGGHTTFDVSMSKHTQKF